ncbi:Aldehyde dehydrogenase [Apiospora saccharicola]
MLRYWTTSSGSGTVTVDSLGIDTNNHVLAADSTVTVGFSPPAILSTLVVGGDPGDHPLPLLSAACHAVSARRQTADTIARAPETDEDDDTRRFFGETQVNDETAEVPPPPAHQNAQTVSMLEDGNLEDNALVKLAQSKLRWDVTPLTPELRDIMQETGQEALHLTFATEETFVSPPVEGDLYL